MDGLIICRSFPAQIFSIRSLSMCRSLDTLADFCTFKLPTVIWYCSMWEVPRSASLLVYICKKQKKMYMKVAAPKFNIFSFSSLVQQGNPRNSRTLEVAVTNRASYFIHDTDKSSNEGIRLLCSLKRLVWLFYALLTWLNSFTCASKRALSALSCSVSALRASTSTPAGAPIYLLI